MIAPVSFEQIQNAERVVYVALKPLSRELRDRVMRNVTAALNDARVPLRLTENFKL